MRYLITGAQGFIGHHLTAHILDVEKDAEVVGIGRSTRNNANGYSRYERLSLLDTVVLRELIAKPFTRDDLLRAVQAVIGPAR